MQTEMFEPYVKEKDIVYTPEFVSKQIINFIEPFGLCLDPCKGNGAFLNNMPEGSEYCELRENKDFFAYNTKVDWIIGNPPYSIFEQFLKNINQKIMTAKSALIKHLLSGEVINVKTCFSLIGLTNCAREISRMVEKPFGVIVSRMRMEGNSRYGQPVTWYDYRLNPKIDGNSEGIKKMVEYLVEQNSLEQTGAKTNNQAKRLSPKTNQKTSTDYANNILKQQDLFI